MTHRPSRPLTLCLLTSMLMSTIALASPAVDMEHLEQADELIAQAIQKKEIPGAVLLVGRGSETVYHKAYGNRAVEPEAEPMTLDTIFDLASLSKPIGTATSIMILAERGKIDLQAPAAKYVPAFGSNGKENVTIEQLLLHRGGLVADNSMSEYTEGPEKSLAHVLNLKLKYEPGKDFIYSDMCYVVLGEVVRAVSGKPLNEFARDEIFKPLGMRDTRYLPPASWASRIAPTEKAGGTFLRGTVHDPRAQKLGGFAGHAGVFGTASDVARYCRMLLSGGELDGKRILSAKTIAEMTKTRCMPDGTNCRAYGFDVNTKLSSARGERFEPGTTFGHTGWTGTMFWIDPKNDCFFVLLTNRNHPDGKGNVIPLRRKVATVVGEALLGKVAGPAAEPVKPPPVAALASSSSLTTLTGLDVLKRDDFAPLKGKHIALVTNHTARDRDGNHIVDLLLKSNGVKIVALFSPEHGLYGHLDEKVGHGTDEKTGLKVWSLYGETRRPTAEMLKGVDTIVYDIQDVGARFYTYSATMGICMEEAAKHKLAMFVLDRPNPITGLNVDGPIADEKHLGFTAFRRIPVAHGMTFGELAQLFNKEFGGGINCDLHVVKMENWTRDMWWDATGLTWTNPSPNMRNVTQATLYPGVCLVEATNLSVGRGTDQPFEVIGAPWIDGKKLSAAMNAANLPGLRTYPIEFTPAKGSKLGTQKCYGIFFLVTDRNALEPVRTGLTLSHALHRIHGEKFEVDKVVRLLQNQEVLDAVKKTDDPAKLPELWNEPLAQFKAMREKHLIYK